MAKKKKYTHKQITHNYFKILLIVVFALISLISLLGIYNAVKRDNQAMVVSTPGDGGFGASLYGRKKVISGEGERCNITVRNEQFVCAEGLICRSRVCEVDQDRGYYPVCGVCSPGNPNTCQRGLDCMPKEDIDERGLCTGVWKCRCPEGSTNEWCRNARAGNVGPIPTYAVPPGPTTTDPIYQRPEPNCWVPPTLEEQKNLCSRRP